MKILESEKYRIKKLYNILEQTEKGRYYQMLTPEIQKALKDLYDRYGIDIKDSHLQKEFEQEGQYREDAGGVNPYAKEAVDKLVKDAQEKFPNIPEVQKGILSGYRSYDRQVDNFGKKAKKRGIEDTQKYNTIPGFSEHHTGKAFDIFSLTDSFWNNNPDVKDWVAENAGMYGFNVTYSAEGTLRMEEPWHLYYYGMD